MLALFDFDGTLADTAEDMLRALNRYLSAREMPPTAREKAMGCISGGARALLRLGGIGEGEMEKAREEFLRRYEETAYAQTVLFPGVAEMLAELGVQNIRWGIVTNKPRRYFAPIAERLQLRKLGARITVCGDEQPKVKPAPEGLLAAAAKCKTPPEKCCYIGDDWRDAQAAQAAKMPFHIAAWGYWQHAENPKEWQSLPAASTAATPSAIPPLLAAFASFPHSR